MNLQETHDIFSKISPRERQVIDCMADGMSVKQIAVKLNLSCRTVESHQQHIRKKLGCFTILETVVKCYRAGFVS